MRSDIVPIIQIGGQAVHIPYLTTWKHEMDHPPLKNKHYTTLEHIGLLTELIKSIE